MYAIRSYYDSEDDNSVIESLNHGQFKALQESGAIHAGMIPRITSYNVCYTKLLRLSGYDDFQLFLCNSGAEANENAIKLASFVTGRKKIISFGKGFHGRTSAAVAITDNPKIIAPVNESDNAIILPLNDIDLV